MYIGNDNDEQQSDRGAEKRQSIKERGNKSGERRSAKN